MKLAFSIVGILASITVLVGCEINPALPPCVLDTDPDPLIITEDTYSITFNGLNFAPDAYLAIHGPGFTYYCDGSEYYSHTCPYGVYVTYSFEDADSFFNSFAASPYSGSFRVINVGTNGVKEGGSGDDRPSGFVPFSVQ